jgi:hypothetical protein
MLSVRKMTFAACTLYVERQDPKGGKLAPFTLRSMTNNIIPEHINLNLAVRCRRLAHEVLASWRSDPISANHISVYHEAHDKKNVALIS